MKKYSAPAWKIASLYSYVLASETRDLAAHIDAAIEAAETALIRKMEHVIPRKMERQISAALAKRGLALIVDPDGNYSIEERGE